MAAPLVSPSSVAHVLEHHARQARKTWMSLVISGFLNPVFTMLALGWGVGSLVGDESSLGTEDYLHFVGPGVLVGTVMLQGSFFSLWDALGALRWEGMYKNSVRTPASYVDVLTGRLAWGFTRFLFSSTAFLVVLLIVIGWSGWAALLTPLIAALTGVATSAAFLAYTSGQESDKGFAILSRLIASPLFVFSGTFTPVDLMPTVVQIVVKVFPGYHGIEITRDLINERAEFLPSLGHLAVVVVWVLGGWLLSQRGFKKALTS